MNLYVSNLSPTTSEKELDKAFSEFGIVVSTKIIVDPATGMPKGFGFVQMSEKNEGKEAIINLDMTFLDGMIINVKEANVTKSAGGSGSFRPSSGDRNRRPSGGGNYNRASSGGSYNSDPNAPRRTFNSDRPYNSDRRPASDRPYNPDRRPSSDRPYNSDRRPSSDRPYNSDRGASSDRPYNSERRPYNSDRPYNSERRPYNSDRNNSQPKTNNEPNFNRLDNNDNKPLNDDNKWNSLDY